MNDHVHPIFALALAGAFNLPLVVRALDKQPTITNAKTSDDLIDAVEHYAERDNTDA